MGKTAPHLGFALSIAALAIGFVVVGFSGLTAVLVASSLAVLFQTFGGQPARKDARGTPFGSGIFFSDRERGDRKTAALVLGLIASILGGGAFALTEASHPVVAGALAFQGVLLPMRQMLWAVLLVRRDWVMRHPDGVLNAAFLAPFLAALVTAVLVAVF